MMRQMQNSAFGSTKFDPVPSSIATGTEGPPNVPPRRNVLLLPMLLAIAAPTLVWAWTGFTGAQLWYSALGGVIAIVTGSVWMAERAQWAKVLRGVPSPLTGSMVAFILAWVICTVIVALAGERYDADKYLPQTAVILSYTATFFAVAAVSRRFDPRRSMMIVCHCLSMVASLSIVLDFAGITSFESFGGRYFGFLGDVAPWLLTLPLVVYFTTARFYYAGLIGVPMLLTASRGPALTIAVAMILLFAFSRGRRLHYLATLIPVTAAVLMQSDLAAELLGRFSSTSLTTNDRVLTSLSGFKLFQMSPIWGSGYNALDYFFPASELSRRYGELSVPTSTFVQMLSEGGVILFAAYAAFVITATAAAIRTLRSQDPESGPLMMGVAAWLISMLWANQTMAWFLVGSVVAPIVFAAAGLIAGYDLRWRERRILANYEQSLYRARRDVPPTFVAR